MRQLRGRIDETQNQVQRQGAELGKRIDDMAFQTQNPQGGCRQGRADPAAYAAASRLAGLPPPSSLGGPPSAAAAPPAPPPGPGAAHAGTGDAGGQCRARPA